MLTKSTRFKNCLRGRRIEFFIVGAVVLNICLVGCGQSAASAPPSDLVQKKVKQNVITTAYFDLKQTVYKLPKMAGSGGAITVVGADDVVLGSADANFYQISLSKKSIMPNRLPRIKLNRKAFEESKFLQLRETPPRLHDLIYSDGYFYSTVDFYDPAQDRVRFQVLKIRDGDEQWDIIYSSPFLDVPYFTWGSGGKMAIDRDLQRLYFTVGDYSLDRLNGLPSDIAPQNKALPWGKVNFLNLTNSSFHVYSIGHRNPQGLTLLRNGRLIATEHGPQGGDEINFIQDGKNYGWPFVSYGTHYGSFGRYVDGLTIPPGVEFTGPLFAFVPSIAPRSIYEISNFDPDWNNDLLMGSLKESTLFHLKFVDNRIIYSEPIVLNRRIRDFKIFKKSILLLTDDPYFVILSKMSSPE